MLVTKASHHIKMQGSFNNATETFEKEAKIGTPKCTKFQHIWCTSSACNVRPMDAYFCLFRAILFRVRNEFMRKIIA